jgi:dihydroorotate dehydrogenase electron transfer subunit
MHTGGQVTDIESSGPLVRVTLAVPLTSRLGAGRFVLADIPDCGYLRTPLFPARLDPETCDALIPPDHPAAALRPGDAVDLIGPMGRGFEILGAARRLLLLADTPHLPALLPLTNPDEKSERATALLLTAATAADLYPIQLLPPTLEVYVTTADGSAGCHGSPLNLLPELIRWADVICAAAEPAVYAETARIVRDERIRPGRNFAQVLVAPPIVCGVGACRGCAVETRRGIRLACTDGPVFDLLDLHLR